MNNDKKLQAKNLYFQTELTKTQIANLLNISRRSLHYWIKEGNWDRLKQSAADLPAILAENCYHIMGQLSRHYMSERRMTNPVSYKEADTLHKLVLTISKLKGRSSLNDTMEMFAFFLDGLKRQNPKLAGELAPYVDNFVSSRADVYMGDMSPEGMSSAGYLPFDEPSNPEEDRLDRKDFFDWDNERMDNISPLERGQGCVGEPSLSDAEAICEPTILDIRNFAEKSPRQQGAEPQTTVEQHEEPGSPTLALGTVSPLADASAPGTVPLHPSPEDVCSVPAFQTQTPLSGVSDPRTVSPLSNDMPFDPACLVDPFEGLDLNAGFDYLETVLSGLSYSKERIAELRNICATMRK